MDEFTRQLEREAASGEKEAERKLLIHRIGRLEIQVPVDMSLLNLFPSGLCAGQTLYEQDGETFPVLRWRVNSRPQDIPWHVMEQKLWNGDVAFFDLQTHALVHVEPVRVTAITSWGIPTSATTMVT